MEESYTQLLKKKIWKFDPVQHSAMAEQRIERNFGVQVKI